MLLGARLTSTVISEIVVSLKGYYKRNYETELEVSSSDKCYHWLLQWISKQDDHLLHFSVTTTHQKTASGHATTKFDYEPSSGEHVFK